MYIITENSTDDAEPFVEGFSFTAKDQTIITPSIKWATTAANTAARNLSFNNCVKLQKMENWSDGYKIPISHSEVVYRSTLWYGEKHPWLS